mgnify:FL=1
MKMGSTEEKILKAARRYDEVRPRSGQREVFKRLVEEKEWLSRKTYGVFEITDEGLEALAKREDSVEGKGQRGLGDFS